MKTFLIVAALLCGPMASVAQSAPPTTYEFLTVIEAESQIGKLAKIVFAPAFQGKSEVRLAELPGAISNDYLPTYQRNLQLVNQQLSELTAAGWELVHVSSPAGVTNQYLFRKAKR